MGLNCYQKFCSALTILLSLPVFFYSAQGYFRSALNGWKQRYVNRDVLISIGIPTLFFRSLYENISGRILFFRPSDAKQDRIIPIKPAEDNQQKIDAKNLSKGFWGVKIFWTVNGVEYYDEETFIVG